MSLATLLPLLRRPWSGLIALIGLVLLAGACAAPTTPTTSEATNPTAPATTTAAVTTTVAMSATTDGAALFPLTITDATGQEFTFDAPPKIGCSWYGCYEALADLGVPAYAAALAEGETTSIFYGPAGPPTHLIADSSNPELWAAAEIDLFMTRVPDSADLDPMRQVAPVFFLHHPSYGESDQQGYGAYLQNLRILGALVGKPEAAEAAIARFTNALAYLQALSTPEVAEQTVAVLFQGEGYRVIGPDNPFCVALAEAQLGRCIGEGAASKEFNAEEFLKLNPDWIVYQAGDASYQDRTDPVWEELTAVKEGRVFDATNNRYYCCSTRGLILALQDFAHHILPDAGIPATGPRNTFDPTQSPLVQPAATAATTTSTALFPLTITDALGQEFTFETQPKLACDWHGCYETMADLGLVLHAAAMRPEMLDSVFYAPVGLPEHIIEDLSNPELWAATEMDAFLSRVPDDPYYDVLREMVPVFFLHHPSYGASSATGYQAYIANARLLGQLSGQPEAAEAAIARFETMIANLKALSTPALAEQSVGLLWSDEVYYGLATDNPFCVLLAEVGLGRCMGESTGRFVEYNAEEVLALNPDLIIYMLEGGPSHTERTDPVWPQLTAVKEGRVYDVIGTRYTCCSMRGLIHSFQEYVSAVLPEAGIPAPGPVETFDPTQSPLVIKP
ncbi:MAG: ABC transporter substrate-binding protein [Caldilineaceae bacterium]|nr:ABC transporter substrate-binding protein [Caldilineaceae bacterium]